MDNILTQLLGISFTSVWWAFGFLMAFCLIGTLVDRLMGKLSGSNKIVHFVLDAAVNCGVLFLLDHLISGITVTWWTLLALALLAAGMMVFSGSGE